jgi:hypothetical protein
MQKLAINCSSRSKTIHTPIESPARVDKKYVALKKVYNIISVPKKPKTSGKLRIF